MKKTILLIAALTLFIFTNQAQTVSDIDGNIYNTVTIGKQVWMKENLKTSHYSDGSAIPTGLDNATWQKKDTANGAYAI